jgi:hypothetical protein
MIKYTRPYLIYKSNPHNEDQVVFKYFLLKYLFHHKSFQKDLIFKIMQLLKYYESLNPFLNRINFISYRNLFRQLISCSCYDKWNRLSGNKLRCVLPFVR